MNIFHDSSQAEGETGEMNDNMSDYKDLIHLMDATPKAPLPDHFTQSVMARIPPVSNTRECSFCFFITGFFYLIMGIVLMAGFKAIGFSMAAMEWIKLQPHLTIGAAIWLFTLGVVLMLDGSAVIKMVRYGTLFYIFFTVFNGILMRPYLHVPYAGVFIIGFVATSAFMGVMLALAVQKMELRPV